MPLGEPAGIGPDSLVTPTGRPLSISVGRGPARPRARRARRADRRRRARRATPRRAGRSIAPRPIRCRAPRVRRPLSLGVRAHRRAADRGRGAAHRAVRRLGRRQVDADGPDRAPDRGRRQRDLPGRRARPRGGRFPRGVARRRRAARARSWSAPPATRPAWCASSRRTSPPRSPSGSATRGGACCS